VAAKRHLPSAQTVPDRPRSGTVPSWGLKLGTVATVFNVFFFGFGYATTHIKDVTAPLQPPVVHDGVAAPAPTPAPTIAPTTRRGSRTPSVNLGSGLRTSSGAPLTSTRHS
jgi:hypothetical protein